jgi:hypothetical protein
MYGRRGTNHGGIAMSSAKSKPAPPPESRFLRSLRDSKKLDARARRLRAAQPTGQFWWDK